MSAKVLLIFALALAGSQAVTEIELQSSTTTHVSSPLHAKSIGIGVLFTDKLVSCHIIFPNGLLYELYPISQNLPQASMISTTQGGNSAFPGCGMSFSNPPNSLSGTYEVLCLVEHTDRSQTLSRKKYHITFVQSGVQFPSKSADQDMIVLDNEE